ncbi:hypothetical protein AB6A40_000402 [Gnathostoma spinigerum]|uniref:oleoyl-[acyl-carrier-protein] hydrolase n=1 Tax=Gnathostoma spinigerum TaxID=75299 RepID=A0ABD6EAC7_9BILA
MGEKFVSDLHFLLEEVRSSLFGILLSIFSLTVHHMIGDHPLSIISPAANRNYKTNEIVGNFLNNLIFVSIKKPDASLEDYLQTFSQQITQFTKYVRVPYSLLVGQLRKKGTIDKTSVLSEILFNCRYDIEDNNSVTIPSSKAGNPQMRSMGYMIEFHVDSTSSTLHCLLRVHSTIGSLISVDNFEKTFLQNAKELLSLFGRRRAEAKPIREVETLLSSKDVCQSDALFISDAVLEERSESVDISLRKLWTKCLEHDEFTETDSFFLVGGDSLMCLRLQKLIKHKWHVELRLDEIIECDNFYRMVALIESRIWSSKAKLQSQVIVRINSTLNKRLLMVFFHPLIGGAILPYSTLMHSIRMQSQDISFIGVQHPNTFNLSVDSSKVPSSIEGLCSLYANHLSIIIRDYFEVIFTGASLGGILAYQTYRSLKKLHKHISRIILIDSRAQCSESTLISKSQHQQQMTKIIEEYLESEGVSDQNDDTVKMAMVENAWSLLTMLVRYKPEKDTSVNVHLLKASKESGDYGWSDLCVVNVVPIAGDHSTMMNRRNSDQLAGVILKIISEKNI